MSDIEIIVGIGVALSLVFAICTISLILCLRRDRNNIVSDIVANVDQAAKTHSTALYADINGYVQCKTAQLDNEVREINSIAGAQAQALREMQTEINRLKERQQRVEDKMISALVETQPVPLPISHGGSVSEWEKPRLLGRVHNV